MGRRGYARVQRRRGVSWDLCRDFSGILQASKETSVTRVVYRTRRTKDEVVHDIGYDGLELCLLDGVEREQCFRE